MEYLILNAKVVNEGRVFESDVLIRNRRIERIDKNLQSINAKNVIDATGLYLLPGVIDDQVHFREPGLTHKGDIESESQAAVAGGVTSFMEMPNTIPPTFSQKLLEEKFNIAKTKSLANYSFYLGASNDNFEEIMKTDLKSVCGLKIFMGSSTGNLLVDDPRILERIFSNFEGLIATHCEHEPTIRKNIEAYKEKYGEDVPLRMHPLIRSAQACYLSSSQAISLAKRHDTRLHVLHISTAIETELFEVKDLKSKKITAEACIHHLWFTDQDYDLLGSKIKWNPAIKTLEDKNKIWEALLSDKIDIVATDHAPHRLDEKANSYFKCPSGGPLVQHSLVAMLEQFHNGRITMEKIVSKMSHNPSIIYKIAERGFIREGYFADLVLVNLNSPWTVSKENIVSKCGWSPFEGNKFTSSVIHTFVSGNLLYSNGDLKSGNGMRIEFAN